jgi:integrase
MAVVLLTQKYIDNYTCPTGVKKCTLFDTKIKKLFVEVRTSGTKTYHLRYTNKYGKTCQIKLGLSTTISLSEARQLAQKNKTNVAMGSDPLEEKKKLANMITFQQLVDLHYIPYAKLHKKSWRGDVSNLNNHILHILATKYVGEITHNDIEHVVRTRVNSGGSKSSANLSLILIRHIFNLAINVWRIPGITINPSKGIPMLKVNNCRDRFLQPEEVIRLNISLRNSPCKMLKYIVSVLLLTGARKREVLDSVWKDIDFEDQTWLIKRTKNGKPRQAFLCHQSLDMLFFLRSLNYSSTYVFPNPRSGQPYKNIFTAWRNARERAGMATFRLHDLRHSFASMLINEGRSLYEVQKLLGHTSSTMTQRYAHLAKDTLREAAGVASSKVTTVIDTSDLGGVTRDETADVDDEHLQLHLL